MPRPPSKLDSLAARKKLLVIESNLNRALLQTEVAGIKRELHQLGQRVWSMGLLATGAAGAGAAVRGLFKAFFHRARPAEERRASWLSKLAGVARTGATIWSLFRSQKD